VTLLPYSLPTTLPGDAASAYVNTLSPTGGSAGTLAEFTSHCESALALLIAEYQDSPLLQALICGYLDQIQAAERGLISIYERALSIADAEGEQLDLIGRIVREARDARSDDDYRRALRVRILVNRSQGRHEELIGIASLFEDGAQVLLQDVQPARIEVRINAPSINEPSAVHARLRRAKAGGVSLTTITHPDATAGRLFLLGRASGYATTNATTGLSTVSDTTRGGALAHALTG
jgi:hypothetical protein